MENKTTHLKRTLSFFLALIMVFGLFTPFTQPRTAWAATDNATDATDPTPIGIMPLAFNSNALNVNIGDTGISTILYQNAGMPNPSIRTEHRDNVDPGSAMLHWPMGNSGLYLLRWFENGRKMELTVSHMGTAPETIMVNFDVFVGLNAAGNHLAGGQTGPIVAYRHWNDPAFPNPVLNPAANYQIFDSNNGWTPVTNYFLLDLNGAHVREPDLAGNPYAGTRVNNRARFVTPMSLVPVPDQPNHRVTAHYDNNTPPIIVTPTLPNYPENPNDDPSFINHTNFPPVLPPSGANHFTRLAPSFNLEQGDGFSFRFQGNTYRFLWNDNGTFYFFIEDGLAAGRIYDFELEFYDDIVPDIFDYFREDIGTFLQNDLPSPSVPSLPSSSRAYVFPGFNTQLAASGATALLNQSVLTFPFAQNIDAGGDPVPHTMQHFLNREPTLRPGTYPEYNADVVPIQDFFNNGDQVETAYPSNGLDIRFNLPVMFNEEASAFVVPMNDYVVGNPDFPSNMTIRIEAMADANTNEENFLIDINPQNLSPYVLGSDLNLSGVPNIAIPVPSLAGTTFTPGNSEMILHDISLLSQAERYWPASTPVTDRVRISVGYLKPSTIYNELNVDFNLPSGGRLFTRQVGSVTTAGPQVHTFLRYNVVNLRDRYYVQIWPFGSFTGRPRAGDYQLRLDIGGGTATTTFHPGEEYVFLPLPGAGEQRFNIVFLDSPGALAPLPPHSIENSLMRSQNVVWRPTGVPNIGIPNDFRVFKPDDPNPARRPTTTPVFGMDNVADLMFWAEWEMGRAADIRALVYGAADRRLEIRYVLNQNRSPDDLGPGNEYLIVNAEIREVPGSNTSPMSLEIRFTGAYYDQSSGYSYSDPIANGGEWIPLAAEQSRVSNDIVFRALVQVETHAIHPPLANIPTGIRTDFIIPGVYFLNARMDEWQREVEIAGVVQTVVTSGTGTPSLSDYLVVDDVQRVIPPPPSDLRVTADQNRDTPPRLTVGYNIPLAGIRSFMENMYDAEAQITVNLYIGQFEEAIDAQFFPDGSPLTVAERRARSTDLNFHDVFLGLNDDNNIELDIESVNNVLRGDSASNTGVVRIADIPIVWTGHVPGATAAGVVGEPINFDPRLYPGISQAAMRQAFNLTNGLLNANVKAQSIDLVGIDENRRFFIFADLAVTRFITQSSLNVIQRHPDDATSPPTSLFTGIVADTTTGTVRPPGPDEVDPTAPENIGYRITDEGEVFLFWDTKSPQPGEEGVTIEWEMMRIHDGARLTDEQMVGTRNRALSAILNDLSADRKGWQTNGTNLTVIDGGAASLYAYDRNYVSLLDRTVAPNSLYFYYVRAVRIVEITDDPQFPGQTIRARSYSSWVEQPVTTAPVQPPINLRQEDHSDLHNFEAMSQVWVSWEHPAMARILQGMGTDFQFQYQLREDEGSWLPYVTIASNQMVAANLDPQNALRMRYIVSGLEAGVIYQLRVRLVDLTGDSTSHSLWSNVISFMTEFDQDEYDLNRDVENWAEHLRRLLEELLRQPFWYVEDSANTMRAVYRPGDMFAGLLANPGSTIPLHNTGQDRIVYYIPMSVLRDVNTARRGFSTSFLDMDILFAPGFLHYDMNQSLRDMARDISQRGSELSDAFVRISIDRSHIDDIQGVPTLTPETRLSMDVVATNAEIRNILTWDRAMETRVRNLVNDYISDPVLRENIRQNLINDTINEYMLDMTHQMVEAVRQEIIRYVERDMRVGGQHGILSSTQMPIISFDAAVHKVVTGTDRDTYVSGFRQEGGNWVQQPVIEQHNGHAVVVRQPGSHVFAGRVVVIPGIVDVPWGSTITTLVARYGLEDLFGVGLDLHEPATRQMIAGSIARMGGAPRGMDPFTWIQGNLDVQTTSRNAQGFVSNQESIAMAMALYGHRSNTRVDQMNIRNFQNTVGMDLDPRFAQAVRAAFEVGLVSDSSLNPAGSMTIGEFLNMMALLSNRVR